MWFTYRVQDIPDTQRQVPGDRVADRRGGRLPGARPAQPSAVPTQKVLTFTSCNPRYSAAQRIVVHALLAQQQTEAAGLPPGRSPAIGGSCRGAG